MSEDQPRVRGFVIGTSVALLAAGFSLSVVHWLTKIPDSEWLYHHDCEIAIVDGLLAATGGVVGGVCGARMAWHARRRRGVLVAVVVLDGLLVIGGLLMLLIGGVLELMRRA